MAWYEINVSCVTHNVFRGEAKSYIQNIVVGYVLV
jgi:hypothetical protein